MIGKDFIDDLHTLHFVLTEILSYDAAVSLIWFAKAPWKNIYLGIYAISTNMYNLVKRNIAFDHHITI